MENHPQLFVLASTLTAYPADDWADSIPKLLEACDEAIPDGLGKKIREICKPEALADLQSEYIDIFDRGQSANPLYETEYDRRRAMAKGSDLSDIAGFYRAFGLEIDSESPIREMLDHVAVELEFYALLAMKHLYLTEVGDAEGLAIVSDAQKKFLQTHLGRFVASIAERPGVQESPMYSAIYHWCADLVAEECRRLEVDVNRAEWYLRDEKEESMNCATELT